MFNIGDLVRSKFIKESCGIVVSINDIVIQVYWIIIPSFYSGISGWTHTAEKLEKRYSNNIRKI